MCSPSPQADGREETGTRLTHLLVRTIAAAAGHGTRGVDNDDRIEPFASCTEHCGANADVLRQTANPHASYTLLPQFRRQSSLGERRILIAIEPDTLGHHESVAWECQLRMESSTSAVCTQWTGHSPPNSVKLRWCSGCRSRDAQMGICASAAAAIHPVHDWHNRITMSDRQCAARAELPLSVDDDQRITGSKDVSRVGHCV
jgi:hypothetical protein